MQTENEIDSVISSIMSTLSKCCRNTNANLGFNPNSSVEVPFSKCSFQSVFKKFVLTPIVDKIHFKAVLSVDDLNLALGTDVDKYIKPNSCTQQRIFGPVHLYFFEKALDIFSSKDCYRY